MSKLELIYFDARGRAELTRLAFAYGNISFEDTRIGGEEFGKLKPTLPFGQLPILKIDGKAISQSIAIAKYAAKLAGLYPKDDLLRTTEIDMLIDTFVGLMEDIVNVYFNKDEADKAKRKKVLFEETFPRVLQQLDDYVQGDYFLVGNKPTFADIALFNLFDFIAACFPEFDVSKFSKLAKINQNVTQLPQLASYLGERK